MTAALRVEGGHKRTVIDAAPGTHWHGCEGVGPERGSVILERGDNAGLQPSPHPTLSLSLSAAQTLACSLLFHPFSPPPCACTPAALSLFAAPRIFPASMLRPSLNSPLPSLVLPLSSPSIHVPLTVSTLPPFVSLDLPAIHPSLPHLPRFRPSLA